LAPAAHAQSRAPRARAVASEQWSVGGRMSDLLDEASMPPFDPMLDYAGCVIQFGYVVYFSVSWPPAAFVCALHTMFRLRSNVLRLSKCSMRPQPEATSGIGLWLHLLTFEAWSCVLINCLLVAVTTDQLDYVSCWTHSLFREQGACTAGHVPTTTRFLIAVAAEHVVLAIVFVINLLVPDREAAFDVRLKKAAFQFKKKFMAEALLLGEAGAPSTAPTGFVRPPPAVDYEAEWASGSELSDAFELDDDAVAEAEQETAPSSTMRSGSRPRH